MGGVVILASDPPKLIRLFDRKKCTHCSLNFCTNLLLQNMMLCLGVQANDTDVELSGNSLFLCLLLEML
jgi:hypothetical protein